MNNLRVIINDVDITDLCTFSENGELKIRLGPIDILDGGNMEPVTVYALRKGEVPGLHDTVQYRIPRWIANLTEMLFPGSLPGYKLSQTSKP